MVAVVPRAAHAFSVLALGWYVSRFQRFCRFAAGETGTFDSARSSMAQLSMGDRLQKKVVNAARRIANGRDGA